MWFKIRSNKYLNLLIILPVIFFVSCVSSGIFKRNTYVFNSPEDIFELYESYSSKINTFEAKGKLNVQSPELRVSNSTLSVYIRMPDSLRIKVEGPMGIDGVSLFIDKSNYQLYIHRDEVLYSGSLDTLDYNSILEEYTGMQLDESGYDIDSIRDEIFSLFLGSEKLISSDYNSMNFSETGKKDNKFKSQTNSHIELKFPSKNADLKEMLVYDENQDIRIKKQFKVYTNAGGGRFPKIVKNMFPKEKSIFTIQYKTFRINKSIAPEKFKINIPEELLKRN